jgi:hypothetical protein
MQIDLRLRQWATPAQARVLEAVYHHGGSKRAAAKDLGIHRRSIDRAIAAVEKKAAAHGYAPACNLNSPIPEPFIARGHSTLEKIHPDGTREPVLQWTKTRLDEQAWLEAIQEAVESFIEGVEPVTPPPGPLEYQSDVVPWVQIGDAHFGMLAHAAETGQNFDLKIAESELCGAIGLLIDEMPSSEVIVINDLGDFTHYENFKAETEASGHRLDADGRFPKMIKVYSRVMRWIVDKALTKAQRVDVIVNQGNHSRTNDIWMAELLRVAYGDGGRVNILNNDNVFIGYRMGNTLVMTHHSDQCRPDRLCGVMTTEFRQDYGETEFHYIDIGHIHHKMVAKEHPGIIIESFNILAAPDKYAHDHGYSSRQCISVVLRSRTYGEVGRRVLGIKEVRDRLSFKPAQPRRAFSA